MSTVPPGTHTYVRMRDPIRLILPLADWPTQRVIAARCRQQAPPVGSPERHYAAARTDRPVPVGYAREFTACVVAQMDRRRRAWPHRTLGAMWEPALNPAHEAEQEGAWFDLAQARNTLTGRFALAPEMFVTDPATEIPTLARTLVRRVGERAAVGDEPLDEAACVARAEVRMQRTVADVAAGLAAVHAADPHGLLYVLAPAGPGGVRRRLGATVAFGVTEEVERAFAAGKISDRDIAPGGVASASGCLFVGGTARLYGDAAGVSDAAYSAAEVATLMIQGGYATRAMTPLRPRVILPGTTHRFRERVRRMGYRETGGVMPGFDIPVMRLEPPALTDPAAFVGYTMHYVMFLMAQIANHEAWGCSPAPWWR